MYSLPATPAVGFPAELRPSSTLYGPASQTTAVPVNQNLSSDLESPLDSSSEFPAWHLWALVAAVVLGKSLFSRLAMPSMWIWGDEMLYYLTSFDFLHWGEPGVPHPGFLNYPPLTSVLLLPVHVLGLSGASGYHASLLIMNLVLALGSMACYLTVREIFGIRSRLLLLLLLVGPTSYLGLSTMSEPLFVCLYLWLLYFFVRQLKTAGLRYGLAVGLMLGMLLMTRKNAIGIFGCVVVLMLWQVFDSRGGFGRWARIRPYLGTLGISVAFWLGWKYLMGNVLEASYGYYGASGYLEKGFLPALASFDAFLLFVRKVAANLGYVVLASFGVSIPLLAWYTLGGTRHENFNGNGDESGRSTEYAHSTQRARPLHLVRLLCLHILGFMVLAAFAAALQMYIQREHPNTRYLMYGRYVEYFAPMLVALAFGVFATSGAWSRRAAGAFVAAATALSMLVLWIIPDRFFEVQNGATSNLGIYWLLETSEASPSKAFILGTLAVLGLSVAVAYGRRVNSAGPAVVLFALVFAVAAFNLVWGSLMVASKSRQVEQVFGPYSQFVRDHPEYFEDGLLVDLRSYSNKVHRTDRLVTHKLLVEHVEKVRFVGKPRLHVDSLPIMTTDRKLPGARVLFETEKYKNKIYLPITDDEASSP